MIVKPLISVLLTAFNREKYIEEAIESVLNSSYSNFELIISDDCSTDRTREIAHTYAAKDKRLKVYVNEKNLGDYANRNKAASYANGEYIMYVDSDDKILVDGFERCISVMEEFPEAGIGMQKLGAERPPFFLSSNEAINLHLFRQPCLMIGPGGTILRRSFFESIGGYPEKYGPANDLYFNLKAVAATGLVFLPFSFNYYRIHDGQELNNKYSYLYNTYLYLQDALAELALPISLQEKKWVSNKNKRRFLVNLVKYFFNTGNISKTLAARRFANYRMKDALQGLFH